MSLLKDNDYSSDDDDPFASLTDASVRGSGKGKKGDKKGRGGDDKKAAHWTRHKDNVVQEKTPKKVKSQSKTSTSWSPPDSPTAHPAEGKGAVVRVPVTPGGTVAGAGGGQLQHSPNVKNQRKRYSQLASSSEDEDDETGGVLLSNKPVIQDHLGEGGAELPGSGIPSQQQSTNPFLSNNSAEFFSNADLAATADTTNVTTSLGTDLKWPSMTQQLPQQRQPQEQAWVPMMPSAPVSGSVGSINPLLFTSAFDHGHGQQQSPMTFDASPIQANNMGFEHAQTQVPAPAVAAASQQGPWGFEEDPFKGMDPIKLSPLLQPLIPQHQPTDPGEVDTNPFQQPSWHAPHPPETKPSTGISTTELPVQYPEVAPPLTAVALLPSGEDWNISEDLCSKCVQQFSTLQPVNGVLEGNKARHFFGQSKLPFQELSAIWKLSDRDQDNALSQDEFCIAMKLVLMRRKGVVIPATLPEPLCSINLGGVSNWPTSTPLVTMENTSPIRGDSRGVSPILVDIQEPGPQEPDALLVDLDDSPLGGLGGGREQVASPQPPLAHIISLDEDSTEAHLELNEEEDEEDEDIVLVKLDEPGAKATKPAKPAPLMMRPPKFKRPPPPSMTKKKTPPSAGVNKIISSGELSPSSPTQISPPPHSLTSSSAPEMIPHIIDSSSGRTHPPPKPPRPHNVPAKKSSSYMALLSSPMDQGQPDTPKSSWADASDSSLTLRPAPGDDSDSEGTFQWKPLSDVGLASSSADESNDRGHSRSTSLDLNKILMGSAKSGDVFGGLPSAVPPKPPPKLKRVSSPPPDSLVKVPEGVEGGGASYLGRPRSLSTGSMASMGGAPVEEHTTVMDTSADALLLHTIMDTSTTDALILRTDKPPPKPKPRKVPILPPKPISFPTVSNHSSFSGGSAAITTGSGNSNSSSGSVGSKHTAKTSRSIDAGSASALRRTGPQNRANLAELYQQNDMEVEEPSSLNTRLVVDSVKRTGSGSGSRDPEGFRSKVNSGSGSVSGSVGLKDKVELKASIRSLKENNEALQDINRNLEQKLFQLMDERVRLARELDLLNVLS